MIGFVQGSQRGDREISGNLGMCMVQRLGGVGFRFLLIEVEYLGTLTWTRAYSVPSCLGCRALLDLSF